MNNDHSTPHQKTTRVYNENLPIRTKTDSQKCRTEMQQNKKPKNNIDSCGIILVLTLLNWLNLKKKWKKCEV